MPSIMAFLTNRLSSLENHTRAIASVALFFVMALLLTACTETQEGADDGAPPSRDWVLVWSD